MRETVREVRRDGRDGLPDHVTTPLLTLLTTRSMDEDYAHVAARRGTSAPVRPPERRSGWATFVVVGLFGSWSASPRSRRRGTPTWTSSGAPPC